MFDLPQNITSYVFSFLNLNCNCGCGDGYVRAVCKGWNECKVICSVVKLRCVNEKFLNHVIIKKIKRCVKWEDHNSLKDLLCMTSLIELNLNNDKIMGSGLADMFVGFWNLRVLHARLWNVSDEDALKLCGLVNLEELDLMGCKGVTNSMLGRLGDALGKLRKLNLEECFFGGNMCYDKGGDDVIWSKKMKILESVDLSYCDGISEDHMMEILRGFIGLNLSDLNLRYNTMLKHGSVGSVVSKLELRCLNLEGCMMINDDIMDKLKGMKTLEKLMLNRTKTTGGRIGELKECVRLQELGITLYDCINFRSCAFNFLGVKVLDVCLKGRQCKLVGKSLAGLVNLRKFSVCGGIISNEGLCNLPIELEEFTAINMQINIGQLARFVNLYNLCLFNCNAKDEDLEKLIMLKKLEKLMLCYNTRVTGRGIRGLLNLRELDFTGCAPTDDNLLHDLLNLTLLENLSLYSGRLTEEYVRNKLRKLRYLCNLTIR